ncbi:MAG: putative 50S ribosomal protein L32 [Candidatus Scalindua rubra]|uniref:Large ribosomal subunit protein bL32 n=1 Tax=Candidatus Scalindua rubra TaxID=1872076 RepID=A0A1E3XDN1_9BACT|nr:MAG: putative 50S ribosomal protein L32 [Candidatus Scalindua rubra]
MALPKRRHSSSRTGKRRSHDALNPPNIPGFALAKKTSGSRSKRFICPHCKQIKRPHTICHNCGYYHDRQVIAVERS